MAIVKVRIAVSVDQVGKWYAIGYPDQNPKEAFDVDCVVVGFGEARYWVEAELTVPDVTTVQASQITRIEDGPPDPGSQTR